jgi:hypothetical protein
MGPYILCPFRAGGRSREERASNGMEREGEGCRVPCYTGLSQYTLTCKVGLANHMGR